MAECKGSGSHQQGQGREGEAAEGGERRVTLLRELSRQLSLEEGDPVSMELEFLQNVYFEELQVNSSR